MAKPFAPYIASPVRNGIYYQARWYDAQGVRHSRGLGKITPAKARRACNKMTVDMARNPSSVTSGNAPKLMDFLQHYLEHRHDVAKRTLQSHQKTGQYLIDHLGANVRINRISRATASGWREWLYTLKIAEDTVCGHVRNAKMMFQRAVDKEILGTNPFSRLKSTAPAPDKIWHYVDRDELTKLLDACPDIHWRVLIALCRLAGLRRGEALAMRWEDVTWSECRMIVYSQVEVATTKKRMRVTPIDPPRCQPGLEAILMDAHGQAEPGQTMVIPQGHIKAGSVHRKVNGIIKKSGLKPYAKPIHTLRKNCVTDWAQIYPQGVLMEWLGHSEKVSQRHYQKVPDELYRRYNTESANQVNGTMAAQYNTDKANEYT